MTPSVATPAAAESGYVLEALVFPVQAVKARQSEADSDTIDVSWGWDWRWNDHDRFEVALLFGAAALRSRPEEIQVSVTATFRVVGEMQTVPIAKFAHTHAPALIFPYIRQVLDELTTRSPYGRILLPPTNMLALMASFEADEATGAQQERPTA